jgi:REP element-mobilizing transposase RayT
MSQYIRAFVPGGTFFFTVTLQERRRKLLTEILATGIHNLECAADDNVLSL